MIAIVKPFRLEATVEALAPIAATPLHVQQVRGYGRQKGHLDAYQGDEWGFEFVPKARIEVGVEDLFLEEAISLISDAARTGRIGDGKIFVFRSCEEPPPVV
ncbi:MAG: P-II family nitrogen regulator [Planctomycetota bacterium]